MKNKYALLVPAFLLACGFQLRAQNDMGDYLHCGTDQAMAQVFAQHPDIKASYDAHEQMEQMRDAAAFANRYSSVQSSSTTYTISVVFHIIHEYGVEDISDAQVLDQMNILNRDYAKQNADTANIVPSFQSIASATPIVFKLANLDPNGNCTNGIDRIVSTQTYIGDDGSKLNSWPRSKYLNVWVVKNISSGAAGYTYLPGGAPTAGVDGIIILYNYVGSIGASSVNTSRALTHEIGHFFNLQHPWGNTNQPNVACGNDGVTDTPVTKGWLTCNLNGSVCNPPTIENVQNYMEYAYCSNMFTAGQVARMVSALNSPQGQRNSLWTAATLAATGVNNSPPNICKPNADFSPSSEIMICAGASVNFTDLSWGGHPTSWNWTFPGGTPGTSTDSMPVIQYNTPGTYNATLTAANSAGSGTTTKTALIFVSPLTAQYNVGPSYSEGFESSTTFTNDWVRIPSNGGWTRVTTAAYTGTASAKISNSTNLTGEVFNMISPSINFAAINSPITMTFRVAFAQHQSTDTDKLKVYISTDCGETWGLRYIKTGTNLSTVSPMSGSFTPTTTSQWRLETITIPSTYNTSTNVRFKFEFTSEGGNNIYLDDINIDGPTGINSPDASVQNFSVFPNPSQDNSTQVSFAVDHQLKDCDLRIFDMTGREVMSIYSGMLSAGDHRFSVSTATLNPGLYFVRLNAEGRNVTDKFIVE